MYVATVGSSGSEASGSESVSDSTAGRSSPARRSETRIRRSSSAAALVVKVRPSTCSGRTWPVATRWTTRAAISVVLPAPAPAITTAGERGAVIAANCSSLTGKSVPITCCRSAGDSMRMLTTAPCLG